VPTSPAPASRRGRGAEPDLAESLQSTLRGLRALLHSLEASGFAEAVDPYRQMLLVLVQQRLWSRSRGRTDLDPTWSEIASSAAAVHQILSDFADVMDALRDVDRIEPHLDGRPARPPAAVEPDMAAPFLTSSVSDVRLASLLGWPEEHRRRRLSELVAEGVLERRGWGRGISYRLSSRTAEGLASVLHAR
jgi:hypothetical protein